jgi:hypothetical protein
MAEAKPTRHRARRNPIIELEAAEVRIVAHFELAAVELTVTDQNGRGYRTWIGFDIAPHCALRFCAATVRLLGGD